MHPGPTFSHATCAAMKTGTAIRGEGPATHRTPIRQMSKACLVCHRTGCARHLLAKGPAPKPPTDPDVRSEHAEWLVRSWRGRLRQPSSTVPRAMPSPAHVPPEADRSCPAAPVRSDPEYGRCDPSAIGSGCVRRASPDSGNTALRSGQRRGHIGAVCRSSSRSRQHRPTRFPTRPKAAPHEELLSAGLILAAPADPLPGRTAEQPGSTCLEGTERPNQTSSDRCSAMRSARRCVFLSANRPKCALFRHD